LCTLPHLPPCFPPPGAERTLLTSRKEKSIFLSGCCAVDFLLPFCLIVFSNFYVHGYVSTSHPFRQQVVPFFLSHLLFPSFFSNNRLFLRRSSPSLVTLLCSDLGWKLDKVGGLFLLPVSAWSLQRCAILNDDISPRPGDYPTDLLAWKLEFFSPWKLPLVQNSQPGITWSRLLHCPGPPTLLFFGTPLTNLFCGQPRFTNRDPGTLHSLGLAAGSIVVFLLLRRALSLLMVFYPFPA